MLYPGAAQQLAGAGSQLGGSMLFRGVQAVSAPPRQGARPPQHFAPPPFGGGGGGGGGGGLKTASEPRARTAALKLAPRGVLHVALSVTMRAALLGGDPGGLAAGEGARAVMEDLCERLQQAARGEGEGEGGHAGASASIVAGASHSTVTMVASSGTALRFTVRLLKQGAEWCFAASCWRGDALVLKAVLEEAVRA